VSDAKLCVTVPFPIGIGHGPNFIVVKPMRPEGGSPQMARALLQSLRDSARTEGWKTRDEVQALSLNCKTDERGKKAVKNNDNYNNDNYTDDCVCYMLPNSRAACNP
jgi:hypothetical protein